MPISPAATEPFLDDLDDQSVLTEDAAPADSSVPAIEPEENSGQLQKRSAMMALASVRLEKESEAAIQKTYDDQGAFWKRRDEYRRSPEGSAAHSARMKKAMSKRRDRQAAEEGRVINRRLNLKHMTPEEKADHVREQGQLRQASLRGKTTMSPVAAAPNVIPFPSKPATQSPIYDVADREAVVMELENEQKAAS